MPHSCRALRKLLILIFLLTATASQAAEDKVKVMLKWKHQFQFAGYYAAIEQGYYREAGLDVELSEKLTDTSVTQAVIEGDYDYGIADSRLILERMRGKPVVILAAIYQHSPMVILTLAESELYSPLDLKGKRVMRGSLQDDAAIAAMLHQERIKDSDLINTPHDFNPLALLNPNIDAMTAYLTNEPFIYRQNGIELNIINPVNYGIDFYGDMLFTSEAKLNARPDVARRFIDASRKGWEYALDNKHELAQLIRDKYQSDKSMEHLMYEARLIDKMIQPHLIEIGHFNHNRLRRIADTYRTEGLVEGEFDPKAIDYRTYLLPVQLDYSLYLRIGIGLIALFAIVLAVMAVLNRKLQRSVKIRTRQLETYTRDLEQTRDRLQYQTRLVDRHIMTLSTDSKGNIEQVSTALVTTFGYPESTLIGQPYKLLSHPAASTEDWQTMRQTLRQGRAWQGELRGVDARGETLWLDTRIEPNIRRGELQSYSAVMTNITEQKQIEALSVTDPLTGLYNRLKLEQVFAREFNRYGRYHHPFSILLLDLDRFKMINDTYGHNVGDQVLEHIADLLRNNIRTVDSAGRWGGEEFLIICPETELHGAGEMAEKIRQSIAEHTFPEIGRVTVSCGVACVMASDTSNSMVHRADKALYQAKHAGRNQVQIARS